MKQIIKVKRAPLLGMQIVEWLEEHVGPETVRAGGMIEGDGWRLVGAGGYLHIEFADNTKYVSIFALRWT